MCIVSYWQGLYRIRIDTADDRIVPALIDSHVLNFVSKKLCILLNKFACMTDGLREYIVPFFIFCSRGRIVFVMTFFKCLILMDRNKD